MHGLQRNGSFVIHTVSGKLLMLGCTKQVIWPDGCRTELLNSLGAAIIKSKFAVTGSSLEIFRHSS
ncbi:hypothetical protein D3C73_1390090 [compost metagenome]